MPAGLLSADQICSPIRLVFDNELMGSLKKFLNDFEVSDEAVGIDPILDAGPAGQFFDQPLTARCMRKEIWSPDIWQLTLIQAWEESCRKNDLDLAREKIDRLRNEKKASSENF